ncbi:C40 family peptidase [Paenibacillus lemnae]|uniref:NlpC/P60 domain-containing protein n=1 Tax=Paenibacillus lemnae TaxID=1330551 RepID=A0A848M4D3_PAELE|nr:C40 family peptidase [Paenibacillus lemnae]NMO95080.1 hypothetical protein [Paenibacillus lemnae]
MYSTAKWSLFAISMMMLVSCSSNTASNQTPNETPKIKQAPQIHQMSTEEGHIPVVRQQGRQFVDAQKLVKLLGYRMIKKDGAYLIGDTGAEYSFKLNEQKALRQGKPMKLSQAPTAIDGQPYLPLAAVEELFGQDMSFHFADGQMRAKPIGEDGNADNNSKGQHDNMNGFADDPMASSFKKMDSSHGGKSLNGRLQAQSQNNVDVDQLLNTASKYLGVRYVFGSTYPEDKAFDCSSFTQYVFEQHGVDLPRTARAQGEVGTTVSRKALQKGDLLFFKVPSRFKSQNIPGHVGIYIGDGKMIHALDEPEDGVQYRSIDIPFWEENFLWAKRVVH